jgi:hypothetical protein
MKQDVHVRKARTRHLNRLHQRQYQARRRKNLSCYSVAIHHDIVRDLLTVGTLTEDEALDRQKVAAVLASFLHRRDTRALLRSALTPKFP